MSQRHKHPINILRQRIPRRATTILTAVVASTLVWLLATQVAGIEVRSPEMGGEPPADITGVHIVVASMMTSVAGWGLLALLERFVADAHRYWLVASFATLAISFVPPLTGQGISGSNRAVLALLHAVVAGVLIPGMLATVPTSAASRPRGQRDGRQPNPSPET